MEHENEIDKQTTNFKANNNLLVVSPSQSIWCAVFLTDPYDAGPVQILSLECCIKSSKHQNKILRE